MSLAPLRLHLTALPFNVLRDGFVDGLTPEAFSDIYQSRYRLAMGDLCRPILSQKPTSLLACLDGLRCCTRFAKCVERGFVDRTIRNRHGVYDRCVRDQNNWLIRPGFAADFRSKGLKLSRDQETKFFSIIACRGVVLTAQQPY